MKLYISILIGLLLTACGKQKESFIFSDFAQTIELEVIDSIDLENIGILNPHYIQCKDSFLIFCSITGNKEMHYLNLRSGNVITRNVIGQGAGEMFQYSIVKTIDPTSFCFADYRQGKIYATNLEKLQNDSTTEHSLVYDLPIQKGENIFRFLETENYIYGIGLLKEGRVYSFDKTTNQVVINAEYPLNEEIEKLDYIHKGALFTGTLMAGNEKTLVLSCFGLIDFYDILPDGKLALKQKHHYFFPKFQAAETGKIIAFVRDDIYGFSDLNADERFVYLLYSGKNLKEKGDDTFNCSHLLVYDWNGTPVIHCELPKSLYAFCVIENVLYGLSRESIPKVYVYSLNGLLYLMQ